MQSTPLLVDIPALLWRLVFLARHRLLMLDYDGTLAPLRVARENARPLPQSLALVHRIVEEPHASVAIVSGRPVEEIERLMGPMPVVLIGEHGWEWRAPGEPLERVRLDQAAASTLDRAESLARRLRVGDLVERKRSGVVLHTRALPDPQGADLRDRCAAVWQPLANAGRVVLERVDGGIELRARGCDKGTAVQMLRAQAPLGTFGVFVGDDISDEQAFHAMRDWGVGVRVGDRRAPSLAIGRVPSCEAVTDFLDQWLTVLRTAPQPA